MKILIVEDDTLLLQGLILAAQTEGYACDGVTTARMAEQSLEAFCAGRVTCPYPRPATTP